MFTMLMKIKNLLLPLVRVIKYVPNKSLSTFSEPKEQKIRIGAYDINYIKVGQGAHHVFCMPGALGDIWSHFKPQVEGFDREKFTVVAWDPPGYGKSRPPEKEYQTNFFEIEADYAREFMQAINIPKYSVLGWSGGGVTALIHAAKYQDALIKLVTWGNISFVLPQEVQIYERLRHVNNWSNPLKEEMIAVYGERLFAKYLTSWVDGMIGIYNKNEGKICFEMLKDIKCPTFLLYGGLDSIIDKAHVSVLRKHIADSKLHVYPEGKHDIHFQYSEDFNRRVQEFLLMP